ncbi:hypothetical protein BS47DRAFT_1343628 [Hydnum rufescens UP504]|uniref:Uncharacterized protein n=1 Tax=Hydnum rufescens UP504 TaxID=1448309 RepID=A0A9P6B063_9AGAM|nr:hypothetical protein BS47DRAFT_1343628 [Hydnum rufescens UP504]
MTSCNSVKPRIFRPWTPSQSSNSPNGTRLHASPLYYGQVGLAKSKLVHLIVVVHILMSIADLADQAWGFYTMFQYSSPIATLATHSLPLSSSAQSFSLTNNGSDLDLRIMID